MFMSVTMCWKPLGGEIGRALSFILGAILVFSKEAQWMHHGIASGWSIGLKRINYRPKQSMCLLKLSCAAEHEGANC